ncbi:collagen alpha-1(X) chain-like [Saccostrea cucullata]|uniref:collagen alpha-1(X) chain-like n=1 Tax=Saccostrea cuccullata TaxID=36930 RepID=UPI002ED22069
MLEMEVNCLKKELLDQTYKTKIEKEECNSSKQALLILKPDHVVFHVVASSNSSPGVVIFDHVISNIGSRYDNNSGIFTVRTTGLYVFSWSIETYGQLTEAALLVNRIEVGITKSDEAPSYYDTTTSFAVLSLNRKDKVWVRIKSGRAEAMHTCTIFSGWKINKSGKEFIPL